MDEILHQPTICVDIESLYDGPYRNSKVVSQCSPSASNEELALVVRLDEDICPVHSGDSSSTGAIPRPLDLQQVDFLGSVEVVKKLFSMPYADQRPLFAVHKMGNTLLLDSMTAHDTNPYDFKFSNSDRGNNSQSPSNQRFSDKPTHASMLAPNDDSSVLLQYANSSFKSLDHLITSSNFESVLGKVTPLYLPSPPSERLSKSTSKVCNGLLTNEASPTNSIQNSSILVVGQIETIPHESLRGDLGDCSPTSVDDRHSIVEGLGFTGAVSAPAVAPTEAILGAPLLGSYCTVKSQQDITENADAKVRNEGSADLSGIDDIMREQYIDSGSPFLPPPHYFMPPVPPPARYDSKTIVQPTDLMTLTLTLINPVTMAIAILIIQTSIILGFARNAVGLEQRHHSVSHGAAPHIHSEDPRHHQGVPAVHMPGLLPRQCYGECS